MAESCFNRCEHNSQEFWRQNKFKNSYMLISRIQQVWVWIKLTHRCQYNYLSGDAYVVFANKVEIVSYLTSDNKNVCNKRFSPGAFAVRCILSPVEKSVVVHEENKKALKGGFLSQVMFNKQSSLCFYIMYWFEKVSKHFMRCYDWITFVHVFWIQVGIVRVTTHTGVEMKLEACISMKLYKISVCAFLCITFTAINIQHNISCYFYNVLEQF